MTTIPLRRLHRCIGVAPTSSEWQDPPLRTSLREPLLTLINGGEPPMPVVTGSAQKVLRRKNLETGIGC